jgi:hypothetical protein
MGAGALVLCGLFEQSRHGFILFELALLSGPGPFIVVVVVVALSTCLAWERLLHASIGWGVVI